MIVTNRNCFARLVLAVLFFQCVAEAQDNSTILPPVQVVSDPIEPSLLEYGSPVAVMAREKVERQMKGSIGDTVALEPGVNSSSFAPGASRPVIRGFAGDRVRVLKNGVGTGDVSQLSEDHVVTADPLEAKTIEILRGPETLLYGSNAIGGSVNVLDGSIPEIPVGSPLTGNYLLQAGDGANDEGAGKVELQGQQGSFNWHANTYYRETNDIEIPGAAESSRLQELEASDHDNAETGSLDTEHTEEGEGRLDNSATRTRGATVGGSYIWDKGFMGLAISGFDSRYGVPGHGHTEDSHHDEHQSVGSEEQGEAVFIDAEEYRIDLRGRLDYHSPFLESIKFNAGAFDYSHQEFEGGEAATRFDNEGFEARSELVHTLNSDIRGVGGVQVKYTELSVEGAEAFLPSTDSIEPALFLFESITLSDTWDYEVGGRSEYVQHDPVHGSTQDFLPISFSTGPVWKPFGTNDYVAGLSAAYTQRAPSPSELYAQGPHIARQIYELGDDNIDKEKSWGVDLTLRKNSGVVTGALTPFVQNFSNFINLTATGEELEGLPLFRYKETDALFWGMELETTTALHQLLPMQASKLFFDFQWDVVRARDETADTNVPRIPPMRTITRLRYELGEVSGALEAVFAEKQDATAPFELEADEYQILNADVEVGLPVPHDTYKLAVFVKGTNLTDEEVRIHSSFLKDIAPLQGRAFTAGLRGEF